jgi:hypothetical protein
MSELENKKKMLVAECEVYRELLKLEVQTYRIHAIRLKKRASALGTYGPLAMSSLPFISAMFGGRKKKKMSLNRLSSLVFLAWRTYKQVKPLFRGPLGMPRTRPQETEAEEYLSKRL